jgi:TetR/AcrR family transcriptional regulator, transcriptional repressor for nem operon
VKNQEGTNSSDKILAAATKIAQAHGYGGLNIRNLAADVGIKAASIYHHFPSKADLAAAVAKRYWQDSATVLEGLWTESSDPLHGLRQYPDTFRKSLESDNRMCLCSFMAAEIDDLPEAVKNEVQTFADVNVAWLGKVLCAAAIVSSEDSERRARAIFAAVAGAQLMARSRSDISLFDALIDSYRAAGLLPA